MKTYVKAPKPVKPMKLKVKTERQKMAKTVKKYKV